MPSRLNTFSIGTFARAAGVNVETIRFYQRKGLLLEPVRLQGSIRRYGDADIARVKFVKSAQGLGFSLDEVAQLLRLEDGTHCTEAADLAALRLADVRNRLAALVRMEAALAALINQCATHGGSVSCPLIASLHTAPSDHDRLGSSQDS